MIRGAGFVEFAERRRTVFLNAKATFQGRR
jgi:hypothetical protein